LLPRRHQSPSRTDDRLSGFSRVCGRATSARHTDSARLEAVLSRGGRSNHGDRWCFRVRKLESLQQVCLFFQKHPLKTKKQTDFIKFRNVVRMINSDLHLTVEGLRQIIGLAKTMNWGDPQRFDEVLASIGKG